MFEAGNSPYTDNGISLNNLPDALMSGLYSFKVSSAFYRTGTTKKNTTWHSCQLQCAVQNMLTNEPEQKATFSFFLPSAEMSQFCYMCGFTLPNGRLGFDGPDNLQGTRKDGTEYNIQIFKSLEGASAYVLLEKEGQGVRADGSAYATFKIVSFCNKDGVGAVEVSKGKTEPNDINANFLKLVKAQMQAMPVQQPQMQQMQAPQLQPPTLQPQMQMQPQPHMQAMNPQANNLYGMDTGRAFGQAQQMQNNPF